MKTIDNRWKTTEKQLETIETIATHMVPQVSGFPECVNFLINL